MGDSVISDIATTGSDLVFVELLTWANGWRDHQLVKVPTTGGTREVLGTLVGHGAGRHLGVTASEAIWTDDAHIHAVPLAGGQVRTVAESPITVRELIVEGDVVLLGGYEGGVTVGNGVLARVPLSGGAMEVIRSGFDWPWGLVSDGTHLYYLASPGYPDGCGPLVRTPVAGGETVTVASGFSTRPTFALGTDAILALDASRLKSLGHGGGTPREVFHHTARLARVAASPDAAYVADEHGAVLRVGLADGTVSMVGGGVSPLGPLRIADGYVHWWDWWGVLRRASLAGGPVETIASNLPLVDDFVIAGGWVFYGETDTGAIRKMPAGGGPSIDVWSSGNGFTSLFTFLVDDGLLHWADGMFLYRVPVSGGAVEAVPLSNWVYANSLAADAAHLYWADSNYEAIFSMTPK